MIKPGLLMWIFKDEKTFYIRFFRLFGIGVENVNTDIGKGFRLLLGFMSFELGLHIIKRRGVYGERVKDSKSPQAFA